MEGNSNLADVWQLDDTRTVRIEAPDVAAENPGARLDAAWLEAAEASGALPSDSRDNRTAQPSLPWLGASAFDFDAKTERIMRHR